jgi:hypothetical protein
MLASINLNIYYKYIEGGEDFYIKLIGYICYITPLVKYIYKYEWSQYWFIILKNIIWNWWHNKIHYYNQNI